VPDDILVLIQRVARSQRLGIALVGRGDSQAGPEIVRAVTVELVSLLNVHPILQGADIPSGYTPQRTAQLADSIDAELVIYLDVLDDPDTGPGAATYYFSTGTTNSALGAPLADCIHDELTRLPSVADRGCTGEDSLTLQQPKAPAVRVELGNLAAGDSARLADRQHAQDLAAAMMRGVNRLYDLTLPRSIAVPG
jgi:hypothetical protein